MSSGETSGGRAAHERLVQLVKEAKTGLSDVALARSAGVSTATISNLMNATTVPSVATIERIANALGVSGAPLRQMMQLRDRAEVRASRLDSYLAAALRAAQDHPYAGVLPGIAPPLASVYLRQLVEQVRTTAEKRPFDEAALEEALAKIREEADSPSTRPVVLSAEAALAEGGQMCLVLAGPGGGKSSLLRTSLAHGAEAWRQGLGERSVPVLVPAAALHGAPLAEALAISVSKDLVETIPPAFFSARPYPDTQWLVLIDGLDEVTDREVRARLLRRLADITEGEHGGLYRFVIASRPLSEGEFALLGEDVPRFELQPFGSSELPLVAKSWFLAMALPDPESTTQRFLHALERTRLAGLARVPLMFAMLCQLHAADPARPLPASRGQIYHDFVALLHKRQYAGTSHASAVLTAGLERYGPGAVARAEETLDDLHLLIGHLAAERLRGNNEPALRIVNRAPEAGRPPRVPKDDWSIFLHDAIARSGLLTARGSDLMFLHQTLLEYLAAHYIMRDPRSGSRAIKKAFHGSFDPSYLGFLLDAAHESGHTVHELSLRWMARRSGLDSRECFASLAREGTLLPEGIFQVISNHFFERARNSDDFDNSARIAAARMLEEIGDKRGLDELLSIARNSDLEQEDRLDAATIMTQLGDRRGPDEMVAIARDRSMVDNDRLWAAYGLAQLKDGRAGHQLLALSRDSQVAVEQRFQAARILLSIEDSRAAAAFQSLAADEVLDQRCRMKAAAELKDALRSRTKLDQP